MHRRMPALCATALILSLVLARPAAAEDPIATAAQESPPLFFLGAGLGVAITGGSSSEYTPEAGGALVQLDGTLSFQITTWLGLNFQLQGAVGSFGFYGCRLGRVVAGLEIGRSAVDPSFTVGLGAGFVWLGATNGSFTGDGRTLEVSLFYHGAPSQSATAFGGVRLMLDGLGIHVDDYTSNFASGGAGSAGIAFVIGVELGVTP